MRRGIRAVAAIALLGGCRREAVPRPPERKHFTAESCPQSRLEAVRKPAFGALSGAHYEPGAGERKVEARFGPPAEPVACRDGESDEKCVTRARDGYASRDDVKAALAAVRGTTRLAAEIEPGAPAQRAARPYIALATTIVDEPQLAMLLTTTAGEEAVDAWARDAQAEGGLAVAAMETSAGHFAVRVRCR
ncbi:MAG TPA: hypothetical protein VMV18_03265 [bacterium]|nr:hypothetical protein [bacterium]